jgi:hypothetical protein
VDAVTAAVEELHSYEVPESIAVDVTAGSPAYLHWVRESTRSDSGDVAADARMGGECAVGASKGDEHVGVTGKRDAVTGSVITPEDPSLAAKVTKDYTTTGSTEAGQV